MQGSSGHVHMYTHVHWAFIQVHTFLERHPGAVMACTTSCDVGIGVGPNTLHRRLGRTPRLWFRCDWGQWKGLPERFGWGWKLTRTLLSARQFGAIRICGLCFGFLFVCFISFIFELWLKRTLSMWRMLNCLLYDWEQGLIGTRSPRNFFFNYVHWFRLHCVWVPENQEAATESNWHTETHIHECVLSHSSNAVPWTVRPATPIPCPNTCPRKFEKKLPL